MSVLREPYQQECLTETELAFEKFRNVLMVLATGLGKTEIFVHLINRWKLPGRFLILVHKEELLFQAAKRIKRIIGRDPVIEMSEINENSEGFIGDKRFVVGMVQSMRNANRLSRFNPNNFSLMVVDEAHHFIPSNKSYWNIYQHFRQNQNLKVLGATATPDRADEEELGQVFEAVSYDYGIVNGVSDGWLVPIKQQFVRVESLDFSGLHRLGKDFDKGELDALINHERVIHSMVAPMVEIVGDRKTLVCCVTIEHAKRTAEIINRTCRERFGREEVAVAICGETARDKDFRRDALKRFISGDKQFLVSVGCFTEGFDAPPCNAVAWMRPTLSRSFYAQGIGRALRILLNVIESYDKYGELLWRLGTPEERRAAIAASLKPDALIVDFVGNSGRHKLINTGDILGDAVPEEFLERAVEKAITEDRPVDLIESAKQIEIEEKEAKRQAREKAIQQRIELEKRAAERRKHLVASATFSTQDVDPFDVFDVTPTREPGYFKKKLPSEKMIRYLQAAGIPDAEKYTHWQAHQLIDVIEERRKNGWCGYNQAKILHSLGKSSQIPEHEASAIITKAIKSGELQLTTAQMQDRWQSLVKLAMINGWKWGWCARHFGNEFCKKPWEVKGMGPLPPRNGWQNQVPPNTI